MAQDCAQLWVLVLTVTGPLKHKMHVCIYGILLHRSLTEYMGMKRAHVSIFPNDIFYEIPFFKCKPMNFYENNTHPVHI
jgi:hypothetical protein